MQDHLNSLYLQFLSSSAVSISIALRLVCPLFLAVGPRWEDSRRRLLIVGQETLGEWRFDPNQSYPWPHPALESLEACRRYPQAVEALVDFYAWCVHQNPPSKGTPFWDALRLLTQRTESTMLWTNLFRCALQEGSVIGALRTGALTHEELKQILDSQRGLLTQEISILAPTAVVFFTGPTYETALQDEFPRAGLASVRDRPTSELARLIDGSLPSLSFRTYHPKYLRLTGRWRVLDDIASAIATEPPNTAAAPAGRPGVGS